MVTKIRERVPERVLRAMAFDRKTFKDKTLGILSGAITHFFMVKLAKLNGQTKWVQHWENELDRLVNMDFFVAILTEIKGKWDKRKAIGETLDDIRNAEKRYKRVAANYITKLYKLNKLNQDLPEGVEIPFYEMVDQATENALNPEDDSKEP